MTFPLQLIVCDKGANAPKSANSPKRNSGSESNAKPHTSAALRRGSQRWQSLARRRAEKSPPKTLAGSLARGVCVLFVHRIEAETTRGTKWKPSLGVQSETSKLTS